MSEMNNVLYAYPAVATGITVPLPLPAACNINDDVFDQPVSDGSIENPDRLMHVVAPVLTQIMGIAHAFLTDGAHAFNNRT